MEIGNTSICRQVLTKILAVIISWRWDSACLHFFFEFFALFKYFTKSVFAKFAVREGSRVLFTLFLLSYPESPDF